MTAKGTLGILVGGGPAPGINSVISAAAIEARNRGLRVLGIQEGFRWLMKGDVDHVRELTIDDVSRIHLTGGSVLGTARDNPTKDEAKLATVVDTLTRLGVDHLITIGGDDTALSSSHVDRRTGQGIRCAHVPKTIDNDLPLPDHVPTFGFQTARHVGAEVVRSLADDARSTRRWYVVVAMGRHAGHLALGIGKAAGATLTLIAEEFPQPVVPFGTICDIVEGAIIKRRAAGHHHGVAVLAEGLIGKLDPAELADLQDVERDDHGHIRMAEVDLARKVKVELQGRLLRRGIKVTITHKNLGYELRCADPIAFDAAYCRDLGYHAVRFLVGGGSGAMVTVQDGHLVPIPFAQMRTAEGRTRVRLVDPASESYQVAREYMLRLEPDDFRDPAWVEQLAEAGGTTADELRARFAPPTTPT
ncbi:MAG: 6-phosphofructokinase [Kofleriaceae bacterium]|nr:6-phosphofructokinase [Myxococcales bacterium]MCB9560136.1 6-phosphofructokinase [Kofleriaceae bacterium]MCB9571811.1 6-phosphofructokinase [Kofleriaceae bacterium]